MDEFTSSICEELKATRAKFLKTVVFVRSYKDCSYIYTMIKRKSGIYFTDPPCFPNLSKFRLVDTYSRILTAERKDQVMVSFCTVGGKIRLVVPTTTFGLGVDCSNISTVIHWGSPSMMEEYNYTRIRTWRKK